MTEATEVVTETVSAKVRMAKEITHENGNTMEVTATAIRAANEGTKRKPAATGFVAHGSFTFQLIVPLTSRVSHASADLSRSVLAPSTSGVSPDIEPFVTLDPATNRMWTSITTYLSAVE